MYGPDYIMLARSDDGDESNIDAESGHLPSWCHRSAALPPRMGPPCSGLLYALQRRARDAKFSSGLCGATVSTCQGLP